MCVFESAHKTFILRTAYRQSSKEVKSSFWARSLFIWVSHSSTLDFQKSFLWTTCPMLILHCKEQILRRGLETAWSRGRKPLACMELYGKLIHYSVLPRCKHRLVRAAFSAYFVPFISACDSSPLFICVQILSTFLIAATMTFISTSSTADNRAYRPALVGAYILIYMGMAVGLVS